ncbi:Signal transduction histidine kinase CheA [Chitinispirillum alkaliphilum]|nr:Signal transduction histidine kinase CheA [Chitinispirillum alkaliphilum]
MSKRDVSIMLERLEEISASFVLFEPSDLQELAQIHTFFEELASEDLSKISKRAEECKILIESIILGETDVEKSGPELISLLTEIKRELSTYDTNQDNENTENSIDRGESSGREKGRCNTGDRQGSGFSPCETDDEILANFLSKQDSVLEEMEQSILEIEKGDDSSDFRRILHTLKGEAGALSLKDVEHLCHKTEDYIEKANKRINIDTLLLVKDCLEGIFKSLSGNGGGKVSLGMVLVALDNFGGAGAGIESDQNGNENFDYELEISVEKINADVSLLSDFISESAEHLHSADNSLLELEENPEDDELVNSLFRVFHTIKGIAGFLSLGAIQSLAHVTEELLDRRRKKELELSGELIDLVFSAVDTLKEEIGSLRIAVEQETVYRVCKATSGLIQRIKRVNQIGSSNDRKKIGEMLVEDGKVSAEQVQQALKTQRENPGVKVGEILVEQKAVGKGDVEEAYSKQKGCKRAVTVKETIKVETEKLDKLVDLIGELVVTEAMVTGDRELIENASSRSLGNIRQLDKITRQLQEIGLSMRMVSMKSTFQKMARLVRDLSRKSGKEITFRTSGEDTELDKSVIERIGDPLVHMVRNSADHGIESPEEREKSGKSVSGTIHLRAFQTSGMICIEIEDDGKGLDKDAILEKALKLGLLNNSESLSDQEIFSLVFQPGFSTAQKVTDVSGRGVGMDVVKKNVLDLRGNIEVKSEKGKGTVFSIYLPLTMAIMDGMVVSAGSERYIIPTLSVVESFRPEKDDVTVVLDKGEMVRCHDQLIPVIHLSALFAGDQKKAPSEAIVMVVEEMGKRVGLVVDIILGQQQTVIKKLGDGIGNVKGISGAAIMPDGNISLIVDIGTLTRMV